MKIANRKGFTMVELLIVLAIIAILAAVAIPVYSSQLENARKEVDNSNLRAATGLAAQDYILRNSGTTANNAGEYYAVLTYSQTSTNAAVTSQNMMVYPIGSKIDKDGNVVSDNTEVITINKKSINSDNESGYNITKKNGNKINGKDVEVMKLQQNTGNARFIIQIGKGGVVLRSEIKSGTNEKNG